MNELRKRDSDILTLESQIIGGVGVRGGGRGGWTGLKKECRWFLGTYMLN